MTRPTRSTIIVRNFVGKAIYLEVNVESKVSRLKDLVSQTSLRLAPGIRLRLAFNGHELRDHRRLSYYGVSQNSILNILPPSKSPSLRLCCYIQQRSFAIEVAPNITVAQLINEISVEEKISVHGLDYITSAEDPELTDIVLVPDPKPLLPKDAHLSDFSLEGTIYVRLVPPPLPPPPVFTVTVELYDDGKKWPVDVQPELTVSQFRQVVQSQHGFSINHDVLILVGKEVVGEDLMIWDLGFTPDFPFLLFNVELPDIKGFDHMRLHPLTPLSKVRKRLKKQQKRNPSSKQISLHRYGFTLDGRAILKEWQNLWEINLVSGSTIYLRQRTINITFQLDDEPPVQMDVEKDDTIDEIQEEYELITERDPLPRTAKIYYRDKLLDKDTTIRREGIVGGDVLRCVSCPWVRPGPHSQGPGANTQATGGRQDLQSNAIASSSRQPDTHVRA